jgi:hypothetical protein
MWHNPANSKFKMSSPVLRKSGAGSFIREELNFPTPPVKEASIPRFKLTMKQLEETCNPRIFDFHNMKKNSPTRLARCPSEEVRTKNHFAFPTSNKKEPGSHKEKYLSKTPYNEKENHPINRQMAPQKHYLKPSFRSNSNHSPLFFQNREPRNDNNNNNNSHNNINKLKTLGLREIKVDLFQNDLDESAIHDEWGDTTKITHNKSINEVPVFERCIHPNSTFSKAAVGLGGQQQSTNVDLDLEAYFSSLSTNSPFNSTNRSILDNKIYHNKSTTAIITKKELFPCGEDELPDDDDHILFEDVFAMHKPLLKKLLTFLGVKDSVVLTQISKPMSKKKNLIESHLRLLKIKNLINPRCRALYWMTVSGAKDSRKFYGDLYYAKLQKYASPWDNEIKKDIDRTFMHNKLFKSKNGSESLFRILKAFANHMPNVGYCQGMNFLAATTLMIEDEMDAFYMLISLLDRYKMKDQFAEDLKGVLLHKKTFDLIFEVQLPDLHEYFLSQDVDSLNYLPQWFNTLFSYCWNHNLVTKIWDLFLKDSWKTIYKLSLAILKVYKEKIFHMEPDKILDLLKNFAKYHDFDESKLFVAFSEIKLSNRQIREIHKSIETGKTIKRIHLFYDAKAGKKNWRYEYDNTSDNHNNPFVTPMLHPESKEHAAYSQLRRSRNTAKSSPNLLATFIQKIRKTFNPDAKQEIEMPSVLNVDTVRCSTEINFGNNKSLLTIQTSPLASQENVITSPSTTKNRAPNNLPTKTSLLKRFDEQIPPFFDNRVKPPK